MGPKTLTLILKLQTAPKGGRSAALGLGLGFLYSALCLNQCSIIRELAWEIVRRCSPFTNRERKKTRHYTSRKHLRAFSSTPNEQVLSRILLKPMIMVNTTSALLSVLVIRALVKRNAPLAQSLVGLADTNATSFLSTVITLLLLLLFFVFVSLECNGFY